VEVIFDGSGEVSADDVSVEKGGLTVFNLIPADKGVYVIEDIRVSRGEAGRETAVYQYEAEITQGESHDFEVPAASYYVRARIRNPAGTVSKWSVPALVGQADGGVSAEPGEITVTIDTAGIAVFNRAVLLDDGSVNTPLEEVINLQAVQGEGKITLNWIDPEDEDVDHIEISYTGTGGKVYDPVTVKKNKETAEFTGVEKGESYSIVVKTVGRSENKSAGVQMVVKIGADTTDPTPPAEVTNLTATAGDWKIRLTWNDPADEDFDHIEVSYSSPSIGLQVLGPVAKGVRGADIPFSVYSGDTFSIMARAVDTAGNKSGGALASVRIDQTVDDLFLNGYVTAPTAGLVPNNQQITGVQYTGSVASWRRYFPDEGLAQATFAQGYGYRAQIRLTPSPGYTFMGLKQNDFKYAGAAVTNVADSGNMDIDFQVLGQAWYVADYGDDVTKNGTSHEDNLATVKKALEKIRGEYNHGSGWPLNPDASERTAVIIITGTVKDATLITIDQGANPALPEYPPLELRGLGPGTEAGIINAEAPTWTTPSRALIIRNGANVTMGDNLIITNGGKRSTVGNGGGVYVFGTAARPNTFTMNGGTITGNISGNDGGGIYVINSAFTMNGGTVSRNEAPYTGGVGIQDASTTVMNGGTITDNVAQTNAGGLRVQGMGATFTMNGGIISNNTTTEAGGGGVFVNNDAEFIMRGGVISGNKALGATIGGGGVSVAGNSTFTMYSGAITTNTAYNYGGGVYVFGFPASAFTMHGGAILGNSAKTGGGGVAVDTGNSFTKQPASSTNTSGAIYGYDGTSYGNRVENAGITLNGYGHAVYIVDGPKTRNSTAGGDISLDSTVDGADGGWVE
jgi:hypothetical protein